MANHNAGAFVENAIKMFVASPSSIHEQLSRLDFVLRIIFSLSVQAAVEYPEFQISTSVNPGLGSLKEGINRAKSYVEGSIFAEIATIGQELLGTKLPIRNAELSSIEGLRNHLFHGGPLPDSNDVPKIVAVIRGTIDNSSRRLQNVLSNCYLEVSSEIAPTLSVKLLEGERSINLSPLIAVSSATNSLLVFSRVVSTAIALRAPTTERSKYEILRSDCEPLLRRIFKVKQQNDQTLSDFTQAAIEDMEGFRELGTLINSSAESDAVYFNWVHLNGREATERQDKLRIGPDNMWQWYDGNNWVGYSNFLRELANWPVLTQRLAYILQERNAEIKAKENALLPLADGIQPPFIIPTVKVGKIGAKKKDEPFSKFALRLDDDVEANRGNTYLYFVHAEAGAGKTTALLKIAEARASECAKGNCTLPLFLYVSAKGNVLENLDQAVDATVADTRLLNSEAVRALCRNGLIIPIVDGFDELVGSPTYNDALSSLRPWLQSLGGRGVLLVSARSNYFVSMYEESISRETNRDINVTHLIAELDRWDNSDRNVYLQKCNINQSIIKSLSDSELNLLRLPFFARASIDYLRSGSENDLGLVDAVMYGYLQREQNKLSGPNGEIVVNLEFLNQFFQELASYMMENNTREVSSENLTLVAEFIHQSSMSAEMRNRLVALCGLDVSEGRERRFRFLHEIVLDYFFGRSVGYKLINGVSAELLGILSRTQLTDGAVRVASTICVLKPDVLKNLTNENSSALLRSNVGLLWISSLSTTLELTHYRISNVDFPYLNMSTNNMDDVLFVDCSFTNLLLDNYERRGVRFLNCRFHELHLRGNGIGISFDSCSVEVALVADNYSEDPAIIRSRLRNTGAIVLPNEDVNDEHADGLSDDARYFLERIAERPSTNSIVVSENKMPADDDGRMGWLSRRRDYWLTFVDALLDCGLVSLDTLGASGKPKSRVRWIVSPSKILSDRGISSQVDDFWAMMKQSETN